MMENKKRNIKPYIIAGVISLVIGAVIFILIFFLKDRSLRVAIDGASYAGIILITVSLLLLIARLGFFDIFSYGFKQLGASMFNKNATKYNDYPGYKQQVNSIRVKRSKYYLSILLVGLLYIVAALIMLQILG